MKTGKIIVTSVITILLMLGMTTVASAGVEKVIDKSNWQEVQGLIPDKALEWVKNGDLIMNVGTLNYDPTECWLPWAKESFEENIGKYDLNDELEIIDAKTGEIPRFIKGFPFPDIDPKDPKAGAKIMYNGYYGRDIDGPFYVMPKFRFVGRKGQERDVTIDCYMYPLDGYGPAADLPNPDDIEILTQMKVTEPYDMDGIATMTWRYRTSKPDMLFAFVPAVRRVRRTTPAGRSDAMFGSDFARDDGGYPCYDGKIPEFEWKLLEKKEVLVAFLSPDQLLFRKNYRGGEWAIDTQGKKVLTWGYEKEGWTGAPWFSPSVIWVKRPVWVIEARSKDPYYNYGKTIIWIDAQIYGGVWKEIWDRAGEYWKTMHNCWANACSDDKKFGHNAAVYFDIVDERLQHATIVDYVGKDYVWVVGLKGLDIDQYSLTGFTKLCK